MKVTYLLAKKACFIPIVLVLFFHNIPSLLAQTSPILNLRTNTSTPALYDIYEISFDLATTYTGQDRFNPKVVDVSAVFTLPNGTYESMPGFFKQEESPQWAIRYAPRTMGEYRVTLIVTDTSGVHSLPDILSFTTAPPVNSGFIEVDPDNPARLRTSNGDSFVMIGVNTAWEDDLYSGGWDLGMVKTFDAMREYNMNFGRVFGGALWTAYFLEASGTQRERGYVRLYEGLGNYQLDAAKEGDIIFQNAKDRDIRFSYVLFDYLAFAKGFQWERNAYNSVNGGPCEVNTCFWTNPIAREFTKRLMRYIFARYGSFTSFGFTEFWNEVDNGTHNMWTADTQEDVLAWHKEMDAYWKSLDFYHHPTTTSYAWRDHQWPEDYNQYANSWPAMPYLDVVNQHRYPSNFGTVTVETWIDQIRWLQQSGTHIRPAYIGEYGVVGETATVRDPLGYYFHDGAWVPFFFAEAAGTNLIWRVDKLFRPHSPTADGYRAFGLFIQPEFKFLPYMKFFPPEPVVDTVQVGKYASSERALLLFRDFGADPTKNNGRDQPIVKGFKYTLRDLTDGKYVIEFWNTMTGEIISSVGGVSENGLMSFDVPSFQRALAVKVYPGEVVPGKSSTPAAGTVPPALSTSALPTVHSIVTQTVTSGQSETQGQSVSITSGIVLIIGAVVVFITLWRTRQHKSK